MPDPLAQAVEELAPAAPATSFFENNASPIFRAASAGRRLEDQRVLGEEIGGLSDSRLQRRLRRREEALMDREELEHAAKQDWMTSRGAFLSELGQISAEDWPRVRGEFLAGAPSEALKDDAAKMIIRFKDAQATDQQQKLEEERRNKGLLNRGRQEAMDELLIEGARLDIPQAELEEMAREGNILRLATAVGRREAAVEAAGGAKGPSRTEREDRLDKFISEPGIFTTAVDKEFEKWRTEELEKWQAKAKEWTAEEEETHIRRKLSFDKFKKTEKHAAAQRQKKNDRDTVVSLAARKTEEEFVEHFAFPGLSEEGREWLRQTYREARGLSPFIQAPLQEEAPAGTPPPVEREPGSPVPLDKTNVELDTFKG